MCDGISNREIKDDRELMAIDNKIGDHMYDNQNPLNQRSATPGTRAKSSTPKGFAWHAK